MPARGFFLSLYLFCVQKYGVCRPLSVTFVTLTYFFEKKPMIISELLRIPLFKEVNEEDLHTLLEEAPNKLHCYQKGDKIAEQGKRCRSLYIVCSGTVLTRMTNHEGKKLTVGTIEAPDVLAPAFVYGTENLFPVHIEAVTDVEILAIDKESFLHFMQQQPSVLRVFLRIISDRGLFLSKKLNEFALQSLRLRVLNYMKLHHSIGNQQEAAQILGVARPSLARILSELIEEGLIEKSGNQIELKKS